jgi:hypothetical protein
MAACGHLVSCSFNCVSTNLHVWILNNHKKIVFIWCYHDFVFFRANSEEGEFISVVKSAHHGICWMEQQQQQQQHVSCDKQVCLYIKEG